MKRLFIINLIYIFALTLIFSYASGFSFSFLKILLTLTSLVIYTCILAAIDYKKRVTINIIFILLTYIVILANSLNMIIKGQVLPVSQVTLLKELLGVSDTIIGYINYSTIALFLIPVIWIFLSVKYFNIDKIQVSKKVWVSFICSLLVINSGFYFINPVLYATVSDPNQYVENYGFLSFYTRDFLPFTKFRVNTEVILNAAVKGDIEESYNNMYEGKKNVVMIMAESLDYAAIDKKATPTLHKIVNNGMLFENYYTLNNNTNASEFSTLTSVPPPIDNTKTDDYSGDYESIPELFNNKGYYTVGMHSNTKEYYDREKLYPEVYSFQESIFLEDLNIDRKGDWTRDEEMFKATIDIVESKGAEKNFIYYMTTYGHCRYSVKNRRNIGDDYNYVDSLYPEYDEYYKTYLASNRSLDKMLNAMEEYYESIGELSETVFIILSDHYPYTLGNPEYINGQYSEAFAEKSFDGSAFETYNIPFVIYDPTLVLENREEYVSNIDVLPTVSDLFGLEYTMSYGTSPFRSNHKNRVEWMSYEKFGIIGEDILYNKDGEILNGDKKEVEKIVEESKSNSAYIYSMFEK